MVVSRAGRGNSHFQETRIVTIVHSCIIVVQAIKT